MRKRYLTLALIAGLALALPAPAAADPIQGANSRPLEATCNGQPMTFVTPSRPAASAQVITGTGVGIAGSITSTDPQTGQVLDHFQRGQMLDHQTRTLITCTFMDTDPLTGQPVLVTVHGFLTPRR